MLLPSFSVSSAYIDCVMKDHVPLKEKLDQILSWIDMPIETRPQFIMGLSSVYLVVSPPINLDI